MLSYLCLTRCNVNPFNHSTKKSRPNLVYPNFATHNSSLRVKLWDLLLLSPPSLRISFRNKSLRTNLWSLPWRLRREEIVRVSRKLQTVNMSAISTTPRACANYATISVVAQSWPPSVSTLKEWCMLARYVKRAISKFITERALTNQTCEDSKYGRH